MKARENLCCSCRHEQNPEGCGATEKDYTARMGMGVLTCKKYRPLKPIMKIHFMCDLEDDCQNKSSLRKHETIHNCVSCRHYKLERPDMYKSKSSVKQALHDAFKPIERGIR